MATLGTAAASALRDTPRFEVRETPHRRVRPAPSPPLTASRQRGRRCPASFTAIDDAVNELDRTFNETDAYLECIDAIDIDDPDFDEKLAACDE